MTRSDSTIFVTRFDQVMTLTLTRLEKLLDDSDSILSRRACDSYSTKITQAHHCLLNYKMVPGVVLASFIAGYLYLTFFILQLIVSFTLSHFNKCSSTLLEVLQLLG